MMKRLIPTIIIVLLLMLASSSFYIVNEDEVAVTKIFSEVNSVVVSPADREYVASNLDQRGMSDVQILTEKGIHFKIPFIQTVEKYTSKYLTYTSNEELINTADSRRIQIQMYAQYRVIDPARFNASVGSKGQANTRVDEIVYKTVINSVNNLEFNEFFYLSTLEDLLQSKLNDLNSELVNKYGIYVSDIGINRKTFPASNITTIEEKMTKEIEKESAQSIAEGDSIYNQRVAQVDAAKAQVIADAVEEAAIIKADADAIAIRTYQTALQVDLEFYKFIERMDIYKEIQGSTIFVDKDNPIFSYLNEVDLSTPAPIETPEPVVTE